RSDQQLRLRHSPESETRAEDFLADLLRSQSPARAFPRKSLSCLNDIPAPPIADRDLELEAGVAAGELLGGGDADLQPYGQIAALADEPEPHPLLVQLLDLALERLDEQAHQAPHLVRGPSPVLAREGEERERLDAPPPAPPNPHPPGLRPRPGP